MLTFEQYFERIKKLIKNGETSRVEILHKTILEDDLLQILHLYENQQDRFNILEKTRIELKTIDSGIEMIDKLNRCIDSQIFSRYTKKNKENQITDKELNINNKNINVKLEKFKKEYRKCKINGTLSKKIVRDNLDILLKMINQLGNQSIDMLFLAELYMDLGDCEKSIGYINQCDDKELDYNEQNKLKNIKMKAIDMHNKKMIEKWYLIDHMSYEEIIEKCGQQSSEYRINLSMNKIAKIINECEKNKDSQQNER